MMTSTLFRGEEKIVGGLPAQAANDRAATGSAVLVVEPNPDRQSRLARMFTVQGHRVVGTSSVDGARALLASFPVDLMLLASELPPDELATLVRAASGQGRHPRVVILEDADAASARRFDPELEAELAGLVEYVARPARMEQVATLVA